MKNNLHLLFSLLILTAFTASAQENSPYTRFGLGELRNNAPAELRGWGNQVAAYQDPLSFDIDNPASLGAITGHAAIFQAGLYGNVMNVKSEDGSDYFGHSAPDYITFATSLRKGWGISFGLLPYSSVNYNVYQLNDAGEGLPKSANQFQGNGSLYEVYVASGWEIKHFSFGVSGSYVFGTLSNVSKQIFSDTLNGFNTNYEVDRKVSGFKWNAGLQYDLVITTTNKKTGDKKKNHHILFGVSGHTDINLNAKENYTYNRFYYDPTYGSETPYDTIAQAINQKGKIVIPMVMNGGIMWKYKEQWKVGVNYTYNAFKSYKSFGISDSTANAYTVSAGAEFTPNPASEEGYYNHIKYRLGVYYSNYYLSFNNNQLKNAGFTVGAGLPIHFAYVDIALDFGRLGTLQNNLIQQSYVDMTLGIKFLDQWFKKRVYN